MRLALVIPKPVSGESGGAERLFSGLQTALSGAGVEVETVPVWSDESTFEALQETYLRCYDLNVSQYDGVLSTKAPTYLVRHERHVCYLVHTVRSFYDMFDEAFPGGPPGAKRQRDLILQLDTAALSHPRTKALFCIGWEVANRLQRYNALQAAVLRPPTTLYCRTGEPDDYILAPGRLHRWKRADLLIDAFRLVEGDLKLKICGIGEEEPFLRSRAHGDPRIEFLGWVSDARLTKLYSNALAVAFVPIREDYGYVALEAFLSGKPVLTCRDSGEPARMTEHGITGLVCNPTPPAIARAFTSLRDYPDKGRSMGLQGMRKYSSLSWDRTVEQILAALRID